MTDSDATAAPLRRVVVAEDESLIRLDIVETLRDNGFEVVGEAGDGETAVQLATELRQHQGAIVLSFAGELPAELGPAFAVVELSPPSREEYYQYLRAILSQRLVVGKDGKRIAAIEVMLNTPYVTELVKRGDGYVADRYIRASDFADKLLSAMRFQFGGHVEKATGQ